VPDLDLPLSEPAATRPIGGPIPGSLIELVDRECGYETVEVRQFHPRTTLAAFVMRLHFLLV